MRHPIIINSKGIAAIRYQTKNGDFLIWDNAAGNWATKNIRDI